MNKSCAPPGVNAHSTLPSPKGLEPNLRINGTTNVPEPFTEQQSPRVGKLEALNQSIEILSLFGRPTAFAEIDNFYDRYFLRSHKGHDISWPYSVMGFGHELIIDAYPSSLEQVCGHAALFYESRMEKPFVETKTGGNVDRCCHVPLLSCARTAKGEF